MVRLETYISVFFDLEKAYDTIWRYGILRDMHGVGLRKRLPKYISKFLKGRRFRVSLNFIKSMEFEQAAGVPQGSILSVTLFAIQINSISQMIPNDIHTSLFVDDLQMAYSGHSVLEAETRMQEAVTMVDK